MEDENLKNILNILVEATNENDFGEDNQKIQNLYNLLNILQEKLPTIDEIDKLENEINYLEIKYDIFNELSYYSAPLFVTIKRRIHAKEVEKLREENRRKRRIE